MASDQLPCGCSRRLVAAVGHYHQADLRGSHQVDEETLQQLRDSRESTRLWQARCDLSDCDWFSEEPFRDPAGADTAARRHYMSAHSPPADYRKGRRP